MSDLVEWLTKILDEDEATARAALDLSKVHIPTSDGYEIRYYWMRELQLDGKMQSGWTMNAVFTPDQALADIAAKRAIIAEYVTRNEDADLMLGPNCLRQREWSGLRLAVQLMATGYADRPGYRDEWKPLSTRTHP